MILDICVGIWGLLVSTHINAFTQIETGTVTSKKINGTFRSRAEG